jgi:hypothetical protein
MTEEQIIELEIDLAWIKIHAKRIQRELDELKRKRKSSLLHRLFRI